MNITIMHNCIGLRHKRKLCINLLSPILVILCELNSTAVEVYAVTL